MKRKFVREGFDFSFPARTNVTRELQREQASDRTTYDVNVRNLHTLLGVRELRAFGFVVKRKQLAVLKANPADLTEHFQGRCVYRNVLE